MSDDWELFQTISVRVLPISAFGIPRAKLPIAWMFFLTDYNQCERGEDCASVAVIGDANYENACC